jgi:hypothetical protein
LRAAATAAEEANITSWDLQISRKSAKPGLFNTGKTR